MNCAFFQDVTKKEGLETQNGYDRCIRTLFAFNRTTVTHNHKSKGRRRFLNEKAVQRSTLPDDDPKPGGLWSGRERRNRAVGAAGRSGGLGKRRGDGGMGPHEAG